MAWSTEDVQIFEEEMVERSLNYQENFIEIAMLTRKTVHEVRLRLGASPELYAIILQKNSDSLTQVRKRYVDYVRARRFVRRLGAAVHLVAAAQGGTPSAETPPQLENVLQATQFVGFFTVVGIAVIGYIALLISKREGATIQNELLRKELEGIRKSKVAETSLESPLNTKQINKGLGGFISDGLKSTLNYFVLLGLSALFKKLTGNPPPGFPPGY